MKRMLKIATSLCITVLVLLTVASCGFNPLENLFPADIAATEATDPAATTPQSTTPGDIMISRLKFPVNDSFFSLMIQKRIASVKKIFFL